MPDKQQNTGRSTLTPRTPPRTRKTSLPEESATKNSNLDIKGLPRPIVVKVEPTDDTPTLTPTTVNVSNKSVPTQKIVIKQPQPVPQTGQATTSKQTTLETAKLPQIHIRPKEKMDQRAIQQSIACMVQEFDGNNQNNVQNELLKFLDTADLVYASLTTPEEKETFTKLIKFRLNGDTYTRISHKQITTYEDFKRTLRNMFMPTYTLTELERKYIETRQHYGEPIDKYGDRLIEALDEYKEGFRIKYGLKKIDDAYLKHLETNSVQIFKNGLNNTIVREKVATYRATKIQEILDEAIEIDRMLAATVGIQYTQQPSYQTQSNQYLQRPAYQAQGNQYTQQPAYQAQGNQYPQQPVYQTQPNQYPQQLSYQTQYPQQLSYQTQYPQQSNNQQARQYLQHQAPQTQGKDSERNQAQYTWSNSGNNNPQSSFTDYRQPTNPVYRQNMTKKYCSFCKTTVSHNSDECRNKLRYDYYNNGDHPQPQQVPPDNTCLEDKFGNMRIHMVAAQPHDNNTIQDTQNQGNDYGLAELFQ